LPHEAKQTLPTNLENVLTCSPESIFLVGCRPVSYAQFWISNLHASASERWL